MENLREEDGCSKDYTTKHSEEQNKADNETEEKISNCNLVELGTQTETSFIDGITPSKNKTEKDDGSDEIALNSEINDWPGPSSDIGRIQVDAVHPLFMGNKNRRRKISVGTSTEDDKTDLCYCGQCRSYFLKTLPDKVEHFVNICHKPDDKCLYCDGPVYYFIYGNKRNIYHKCHKDHVESQVLDKHLDNNNIS